MDLSIRERIAQIRHNIRQAAERSGRKASDIRLMAVTKTVNDSLIGEAVEAGVHIIGENYVQEAKRKIEMLGRPCEWHMIGHLQTNKAKYAVRLFDMIHSVDRMELAVELARISRLAGKVVRILIEVNVSGEAAKHGVLLGEAMPLIRRLVSLEGLSIRGFMTMPPWFDNPEHARPYFSALRELRDDAMAEIGHCEMKELSMGMSGDYHVAVEEGATIVRIGRAIFGERPPGPNQ